MKPSLLHYLRKVLLLVTVMVLGGCQSHYHAALKGTVCEDELASGRLYANRRMGVSIKVPPHYIPVPGGYSFQLLESRTASVEEQESLMLGRNLNELEIAQVESALRREFQTGQEVAVVDEGDALFNGYPGHWQVLAFPMSPQNTRMLRVDIHLEGQVYTIILASNEGDFDQLFCQYRAMVNSLRLAI